MRAAFGRMDPSSLDDKNIQVILIKNPTGFNQVLKFSENGENPAVISFLINDQLADGTDISWLWDVNFESPCGNAGHRFTRFFCLGAAG